MSFDLEDWLARGRERIETALAELLPPTDEPPELLHEAMRYAVFTPAKRLRPALAFGAAAALSADPERVVAVAAAAELVHAYSLVHDDLPAMDDDAERRGQPSVHIKFGEANAILVGDALLALAFEVLAQDGVPAAVLEHLARAAGSRNLVGGQADDLSWPAPESSAARLQSIHERKTAALFGFAVCGAARTCQAPPAELASLERFARHCGLAFQAADDLADDDPKECSILQVLPPERAREYVREQVQSALAELARFGVAADPLRGLAETVARATVEAAA